MCDGRRARDVWPVAAHAQHEAWRPQTVRDYLGSPAAVHDLDPAEVLLAHGWRFRGLADRVDESRGRPPRDLAARLTWSRRWEQYERRMRIVAMTETDAHLQLPANRGRVVSDGGPVPTWTRAVR